MGHPEDKAGVIPARFNSVMNITLAYTVTPWSLIGMYQSFGEICCLHLHGSNVIPSLMQLT